MIDRHFANAREQAREWEIFSAASAFPSRVLHWLAAISTAALVLTPGIAISQDAVPQIVESAALPHDLSPWSMFRNADQVVKMILIGLAFASVVTWTVGLAKGIEILLGRRAVARALLALRRANSLAGAREKVRDGMPGIFLEDAAGEWSRSDRALPAEGIKERTGILLQRREASFSRRISRGTGVLATIGATAPFVGLFGTVWGIMNSFINISKAHTTNLAVVAPGIAEALLATAVGLAAAIPAVVIYNVFARAMAGYRAEIADAAAEVVRLLGRDLDTAGAAGPHRTPAPFAHISSAAE